LLASGAVAGTQGAQAAGPAASEPFFFSVSPIQATSLPGQGATRYQVTVSGAPVGNVPYARWYVDLKPDRSDGPCSNDVLPGATRLSATRYMWKNQGTSFVWYHGPVGSYAADRSYGCDQTKLGQSGYPGTVTVVFENDSEHCTASFSGTATGNEPKRGSSAVCELGGYLPLAVPRPLLRAYAKSNAALAALTARIRSGDLRDSAEIAQAIDAAMRPQRKAFQQFFPPAWGCRFDTLFEAVVMARSTLGTQVVDLDAGKRPSRADLAADSRSLQAIADILRACRPSAGRPVGAPASVIDTALRLAATARAIGRGETGPALRAKLRSLDGELETTLITEFPPVFGMPYSELVDRVLALQSAVAQANEAAANGDSLAAASALEHAADSQRTIDTALHRQAARAAKAAKAA
jgi:hypothetical protein